LTELAEAGINDAAKSAKKQKSEVKSQKSEVKAQVRSKSDVGNKKRGPHGSQESHAR